MNKQLMLKLAVAGLMAGVVGTAAANPRGLQGGNDYARVVDVTPIVRQVRIATPAQECWTETQYQAVRHETPGYGTTGNGAASVGATIAGGLIGGVIGRQFGGGSGKDAMTAVGAVVGATVANQAVQNQARAGTPGAVTYTEQPVTVERCQSITHYREEERVEGYRVTYLYADREYVTTMSSPPGTSIPVRVTVIPAGGRL